jgi:hypothetical protein
VRFYMAIFTQEEKDFLDELMKEEEEEEEEELED